MPGSLANNGRQRESRRGRPADAARAVSNRAVPPGSGCGTCSRAADWSGWNFAFQLLRAPAVVGVQRRDRREQRLGVGMARGGEQLARRRGFHQRPRYITATWSQMCATTRQIVADEQERQPQVVLQLLQQVQDIGLDRHVQRRHAFVGHHELRTATPAPGRWRSAGAARRRRRAGSGAGVPGSAGTSRRSRAPARRSRSRPLVSPMTSSGSAMMSRTVMRGRQRRVGVLEDQLRALAVVLQLRTFGSVARS